MAGETNEKAHPRSSPRPRSASWAGPVFMPSTGSGTSGRSGSRRPSAIPRTPTSSGPSKDGRSPSSAATAAATAIFPSEINYRANVYGFKMLGVARVISVSAVGSLREEIRPRDIVFADQFIDKTHRPSTFFGDGLVAHVGLAQPVCGDLSRCLYDTAVSLGVRAHLGGTYVCMEGPAFSTKAE